LQRNPVPLSITTELDFPVNSVVFPETMAARLKNVPEIAMLPCSGGGEFRRLLRDELRLPHVFISTAGFGTLSGTVVVD
jgi:hypothetical protein